MDIRTHFPFEALLPLVSGLAARYTSGDSTSIPYETAEQLMEAVLYCMEEGSDKDTGAASDSGTASDAAKPYPLEAAEAEALYLRGYAAVLKKAETAKQLYEQILESWDSYGCTPYEDTLLRAVPAFFTRYDARFRPQHSVIDPDYPLLFPPEGKGVTFLLNYLTAVRTESRFLSLFGRSAVTALLERTEPDFPHDFMGNLCFPVLLTALGCMIAEKPVPPLQLSPEDLPAVAFYLEGEDPVRIERKLSYLIRHMTESRLRPEETAYLAGASKELSARLSHCLQIGRDTLCGLFFGPGLAAASDPIL